MIKRVVIDANKVAKRYRIGSSSKSYDTMFGKITSIIKKPFDNYKDLRSLSDFSRSDANVFWALEDISFKVYEGEVLGIIGHNGAGKSTLLKILSRITEPTYGTINIKGRVASLLEVGTGMHPDLTGRDNIYMNGSLLGMSKSDIDKRFDEIVEFSGIEKFIDTPVKRFSSGMSVRLGFAVAAHLEPEILLVDEVLAVGDVEFRKKCLNKMNDVAKGGRTILFVSHNLSAIRNLCSRCILLNKGKIEKIGSPNEMISSYLKSYHSNENFEFSLDNVDKNKSIQVINAYTMGDDTKKTNFTCDENIYINIVLNVNKKVPAVYGYLSITDESGDVIMVSISNDNVKNDIFSKVSLGKNSIRVRIPPRTLGHGKYNVSLGLASSQNIDSFIVDSPGKIAVFELSDEGTNRGNNREGYFSTILDWKTI